MSWIQYFDIVWKIAIVLTPLVIGGGILWLKSQFATKSEALIEKNRVDGELKRVDERGTDHETRIKLLEKGATEPPTRHELNDKLQRVVAGVAALDRAVSGMSDQQKTTNDYLHTLIEKGLEK